MATATGPLLATPSGMQLIHFDPNDVRWLRRWLRNNLVLASLVLGGLLVLRLESLEPVVPSKRLHAQRDDRTPNHLVEPAIPNGWRRTERGWEDASHWRLPRPPLEQIILAQQTREPQSIQALLGFVRSVPPLAAALIQLVLIWLILMVSRWSGRGRQAVDTAHAATNTRGPSPGSGWEAQD